MRQLFIYFLLLFSSLSFANGEPEQKKLTLDQAIINVLEQSPLLKAADYESKAAAARIRQAQLSPAFRTSIELENFAGSGINSGSDRLESTLSLSKVLELGDKAKLRGQLAFNKTTLLGDEQDAKRLDLLAETTKRFIYIITNQERLVIAADSLALAKRTHKLVEQRVKAGKSPNAELRRVKIALARKQLKLHHAEHELATSRLKLVTLWGTTQVLFSSAEANLFVIEDVLPFETLLKLLEQNPDLLRYATEERIAKTRVQLAKSGAYSNLEVSAGLRHFNATDDTAMVFSLSMPLGSSSRSKSKVEEAEMSHHMEPLAYEQQKLSLHVILFELYQEIKHAADSVMSLREIIIPQAKRALQDYEKGYKAGRYSLLELTEAQRQVLDSRLEAVIAARDYHQYHIEIDRLTGARRLTGETR